MERIDIEKVSGGPRTVAGKMRVGQNRRSHGLSARVLIVPTDDAPSFEHIRGIIHSRFLPRTRIQQFHVNLALHAAWNLWRAKQFLARLDSRAPLAKGFPKRAALVYYRAIHAKRYRRALANLRAMQAYARDFLDAA